MTDVSATESAPPKRGLSRSLLSWSIFEGGRGAYGILVGIYVFIPYVASVLTGDPVRGQHLVAELAKWGGLAAAFTAPLVGVTIDHIGPRKPGLLLLTLLAAPLLVALWWASPDKKGLTIREIAWMLATVGVLFGFCEVLFNSMLVYVADERERPAASGVATAIGNAIAVSLMIFTLWAFMLPSSVHAPWLPARPLFGLDPATHQPERAMGPLCAVALLLTLVPFLIFTRDAPRTGIKFLTALKLGLRDLRGLLGILSEEKNARNYLFARLIFADGQAGVAMFAGVFVAGIFRWGSTQLLIEGLMVMVCGVAGGYVASRLDARLNPKTSLIISLIMTILTTVWVIGLASNRLFFFWSYDPAVNGRPWNGPIFNTWPEWAYIGADLIGLFFVVSLASSRTMMALLVRPERTAAFFGLYALAGRATAWLCPMLVGIATASFHSQQLGLAPAVGLLIVGLAGLIVAVRMPGDLPKQEAARASLIDALPDVDRAPIVGQAALPSELRTSSDQS